MRFEIPVDPDADEARRWLQDELAKPEYRAAEPNWFDRLMAEIGRWLDELFSGGVGVPQPVLLLLVIGLIVALVVVGLLVFGLPRLRRRRAAAAPLFDDGDTRDLAELRRAAAAAAAAGDWSLAIQERFRAIVRGLVDRELVRVYPGTTAHGVVDASGTSLPAFGPALDDAAAMFDRVRYLGRDGDAEGYARLSALDDALWRATPVSAAAAFAGSHG